MAICDHLDLLTSVGDVPDELILPVLARCTPEQLMVRSSLLPSFFIALYTHMRGDRGLMTRAGGGDAHGTLPSLGPLGSDVVLLTRC
jgi:hypothetical protein